MPSVNVLVDLFDVGTLGRKTEMTVEQAGGDYQPLADRANTFFGLQVVVELQNTGSPPFELNLVVE